MALPMSVYGRRHLVPACLTAVSIALCALCIRLRRQLASIEDQLTRAKQLRQEERAGRTAAERRLRQQQQQLQRQPTPPPPPPEEATQSAAPSRYTGRASGPGESATGLSHPKPDLCTYRPIGHLRSCFVERRGTPRQGLLVPMARARLRLDAQVVQPAAALDGLAAFSHVWLLFDFHENTNTTKLVAGANAGVAKSGRPQVRAKVHPPGLDGARIGLFATRTPHRPNPIGLSVVELLSVDGESPAPSPHPHPHACPCPRPRARARH